MRFPRRSMLIQAGGAALATMVGSGCARSAPSGGASAGRLLHRVRPSDPAWPRAAAWETLNRQVGGRLIKPAWPLEACRDAPRSESCAEVFKRLRNPYYLGDEVGLTQTLGWVDAWTSRPSAYAVAARTSADVVAAVNFAREHRLRLVVKGGGHSYLGTSNAPDSLLIWTRRMNAITVHDAFVAAGCGGRDAARLIGEVIAFYAERLFNPHWGEQIVFARDNTLRISMLFQGLTQQQAEDVWRPFLDRVAASPREFETAAPPRIRAVPARQFWDPTFLSRFPGITVADDRPNAPAGNVVWAADAGQVGQFIHGLQSTWLPGALLRGEAQQGLGDALFAATRHWGFALHFNKGLGGAPADEVAAARDTAMNPAVLDAVALVMAGAEERPAYPGIAGHEPDVALARRRAAAIAAARKELRKHVPAAGAYVSESDFFEEDWARAYWGSNYERLLAVKDRYDPDGLFLVHHGVGSERWSPDGFTRLA